ncbi:hypothetical protein [Streptomyces incanus]
MANPTARRTAKKSGCSESWPSVALTTSNAMKACRPPGSDVGDLDPVDLTPGPAILPAHGSSSTPPPG